MCSEEGIRWSEMMVQKPATEISYPSISSEQREAYSLTRIFSSQQCSLLVCLVEVRTGLVGSASGRPLCNTPTAILTTSPINTRTVTLEDSKRFI